MNVPYFPRWPAVAVACAGFVLHAYISLVKAEGGPSAFSLGLLAWSSLPYVICLVIALRVPRMALAALVGAIAAFGVDMHAYYAVFVSPGSSTAALALLFMPLLNLLVSVPLGMLLGFGAGRWLRRRR